MLNSAIRLPRTTLNLIGADQRLGLGANRALIFAQIGSGGTASAGLTTEVPRTPAEINALFGATSMAAFLCREFRRINPWTVLDVRGFADNGSGVAAYGTITWSGTATADGSFYVTVGSKRQHRYKVDVAIDDTAADIATALKALADADAAAPTAATITTSTTSKFTAVSKGTWANGFPLIVEGAVAGITYTVTGFANGATDPSLTGAFDVLANTRHLHMLFPSTWERTGLKDWLDSRFNVDNDVKDGRCILWEPNATDDIDDLKTASLAMNSASVVLLTNRPNATAAWKGPHLPEAPDLLATIFGAARARRYETGVSVSDIVATNESLDQFGGVELCSLPYFNTPFLGVGQPLAGTGYTQQEQVELEGAGITVVGANDSQTGVLAGAVVTTWQADVAGNDDSTWKYLEWIDTHSAIREILVNNLRKKFSQYRLSFGDEVAGRAIVTPAMMRAYIMELCLGMMDQCLIVKGQVSRQYIQDNMVVSFDLQLRQAQITLKVPMVSQLEAIQGVISYTFQAA
jgi:phage tail sheath gpL-like